MANGQLLFCALYKVHPYCTTGSLDEDWLVWWLRQPLRKLSLLLPPVGCGSTAFGWLPHYKSSRIPCLLSTEPCLLAMALATLGLSARLNTNSSRVWKHFVTTLETWVWPLLCLMFVNKMVPYNRNCSRKKMFTIFANLRVFTNIFLVSFHFFITTHRWRCSRLKHSAAIALKSSRLLNPKAMAHAACRPSVLDTVKPE